MKTNSALLLAAVALICCDGTGSTSGATAPSAAASEVAAATASVHCYSVAELGAVIDNVPEQTSLGINSRGVVVGTTPRWSTESDPRRAFMFEKDTLSPLGDLGGGLSEARAVNASGLAVGGSLDATGRYRAASFRKGVVTDLGALDAGSNSWSWALNDAGYAVGNGTLSGVSHAAAFYKGEVIDLGSIGGDTYANDVNDSFEVVGTGQLADGTWSGFVLREGQMKPFGMLGVPGSSTAIAINNRGTVCGSTYDPFEYLRQAFLHYRDGTVVELQGLGYPYTFCTDVSDTGLAVGIADDFVSGWRAVVWADPSVPPIDLNSRVVPALPDVQLYWASSINSAGMITAYGVSMTTWEVGGYLLSPERCPK